MKVGRNLPHAPAAIFRPALLHCTTPLVTTVSAKAVARVCASCCIGNVHKLVSGRFPGRSLTYLFVLDFMSSFSCRQAGDRAWSSASSRGGSGWPG